MSTTECFFPGLEIFNYLRGILSFPALSCLENTIKNKDKSYKDKVSITISVCQSISEFIVSQNPSEEITKKIIEAIYSSVVRVILNSGWLKVNSSTKKHLHHTLKRCLPYLRMKRLFESCRFLLSLMALAKDPWGHPTIHKILTDQTLDATEITEFFNREPIFVIGLRVSTLIDSKSEDLALKLLVFVVQRSGLSIKTLIHVFIRVITNVINSVENERIKNNDTKVKENEEKLCNIFLSLVTLFHDSKGISRELLLTAFSLQPTNNVFKLIESCNENDFQNLSPDDSQDMVSERKPFARSLGAIPPYPGKDLIESDNYDSLLAPSDVINDCEKLNIPKEVAHDLINIICQPRYKRLSWIYDWQKLKKNCALYIENGVSMRNPNQELKYLNIDFSQFLDAVNGPDASNEIITNNGAGTDTVKFTDKVSKFLSPRESESIVEFYSASGTDTHNGSDTMDGASA